MTKTQTYGEGYKNGHEAAVYARSRRGGTLKDAIMEYIEGIEYREEYDKGIRNGIVDGLKRRKELFP